MNKFILMLFCLLTLGLSGCDTLAPVRKDTATILSSDLDRLLFDEACEKQNVFEILQLVTKKSDQEVQEMMLRAYEKRSKAYLEIMASIEQHQEFPLKWEKYRYARIKASSKHIRLLINKDK